MLCLTAFISLVPASSEKSLRVIVDYNGGRLYSSKRITHYGYTYGGVTYGDDECFTGNGYDFPYRKGYAFVGFFYDKKGTKPVKSEEQAYKKASKKKNGRITIYAKWTKKCRKITFVPGNQKILNFKTQKYSKKNITVYIKKGKTIGSAIPSYPFQYAAGNGGEYSIEWYRDKALKHKVNIDKLKPRKNMKLYAKYKWYS